MVARYIIYIKLSFDFLTYVNQLKIAVSATGICHDAFSACQSGLCLQSSKRRSATKQWAKWDVEDMLTVIFLL